VSATVTDPVPPSAAVPDAAAAGAPALPVTAEQRRRLTPEMPSDGVSSWLWAGAIALLAGIIRFTNLAHPKGVIFDEVYYRKDAWALLHHGYEVSQGSTGAFVAHPPLGKWCIALGQWLFGNTEFGWRFSAAVAGTVAVFLVVRIGRRLFRSTLLGGIAGLLLALDGLAVVMSRVALLDVFLMVFVLAAFGFLLLDRDARRRQVLRDLEEGRVTAVRLPRRGRSDIPWWRLAAAVMLGCALGVKWSAVWYVIAFTLLVLAWEVGVRRTAGVRHRFLETQRELGWLVVCGCVTVLTYLATWTGWFVTSGGYNRDGSHSNIADYPPLVPKALVDLVQYHSGVLGFHTHLTTKHDYESGPWSWLLLGRPVAFAYSNGGDCGAAQCSSETLALGTPTLWWSFLPVLVAVAFFWIARRDWRAAAILVGVAAGLAPWLLFPDRTMFFFYTLPALPFLVLAVTYVLGVLLGPRTANPRRRLTGVAVVGLYLVVVAATFAYFYPIYTSETLTYAQWHARMWLESWI
jgi:dolichyl-phosphate-mannose-protein mannosyltransferase